MRAALLIAIALGGCGTRGHADGAETIAVRPVASAGSAAPAPPSTGGPDELPLDIALSDAKMCARVGGRVYCTSDPNPELPIISPQNERGIEHVAGLVLSLTTECYWDTSGNAFCAGANAYGQLGARLRVDESEAFVPVAGLTRVKQIVLGPSDHACALTDDQRVRCWGRNDAGQTGSDTNYDSAARELVVPTVVAGLEATHIALSDHSTIAIAPDGKVFAWGSQPYDPKHPDAARTQRPTVVPALAGMTEISGSDSGFCGLRGGRVFCWDGAERMLTTNTPGSAPSTPVAAPASLGNVRRFAMARNHGCALLGNGRISCLGFSSDGALGRVLVDDDRSYNAEEPGLVEGVPAAVAIVSAGSKTCAISRESELYCWGTWWTEQGTKVYPRPTKFRLR